MSTEQTARLLLLGATGFAGRHFRPLAERAGFEVVDASSRRGEAELRCDLLDRRSIELALEAVAPDQVVNLAGAASVSASLREPVRTFELNALGALNALDAIARQAPEAHVLCVSSGEVYGSVPEDALPIAEDQPLRPTSPYAVSKAAMELLCRQHERLHGLRIAVVRAFNHTGPGQSDAFVASSFARQVAEAERRGARELVLRTGDLTLARDFSDGRDIARAYLAIVERGLTGTFNACSERSTRIGALVDHIRAASSLTIHLDVDEDRLRPNEAPVLYGSAERLREATGWRPEIPLSRTVSDLLDWWRARVRGSR